jgi:hypothetical protein
LPAAELTAVELTLHAARNLRAPAVQPQPNLSFGFSAIMTPNHRFQTIKANSLPRSQSRMFISLQWYFFERAPLYPR